MKKMDKYQKMVIGFLITGISIALIYVIVVLNISGNGSSGSDESSFFPYYIFFPSWVAIFIPIIARQRQEEKRKREEFDEEEQNVSKEERKLSHFWNVFPHFS